MESNLNDAALLRRYAEEKSEPAFAELVQRHLGLVYRAALRQCGGDTHRAEDVAQLVFTDLARKAAALSRRSVLAGWLYTSTRYAATQAVRTEARRQAREQELHAMNDILSSPGASPLASAEAIAEWERLRPVIDDALHALGERDREAVLLRFFEGRAFAEIGAKLSLGEDAARRRVDRALEKLRFALVRRGITSTAAALGIALTQEAAARTPAGLAASVTGAALAGASGVGAATAFLTFMSTAKIASGIAVAVALLAIYAAVRESGRTRESAAELNALTLERDNLRAAMRALKTQTRPPDDHAASTPPELADQRASASSSIDGAARRAAWQSVSPVNFALDHPEARTAFIAQELARAKAKFERFFKLAGLSTPEQEKFLAVLKDFAEAKLDLTASVREQGYGPNNVPQDPQALLALFKVDAQVDAEFMGELSAQLGEERFKQFSAYRKTMPEINVADQLASQLYDSDAPLTPQQARQLVQILQENRYDKKATPSPANTLNGTFIPDQANQAAMGQSNLIHGDIMMPGIDWRAPVTDAAIAHAETVLAPAQLAALRQLQAQQAAQLLLAPPAPKQPDISVLGPKPSEGR